LKSVASSQRHGSRRPNPASGGQIHEFAPNLEGKWNCRTTMGHLQDIEMSWFAHFRTAWKLAFVCLLGSVRLLIHGVFPNVDVAAGRKTAAKLLGQNFEE
jgi:hypothetical protein